MCVSGCAEIHKVLYFIAFSFDLMLLFHPISDCELSEYWRGGQEVGWLIC